MRFSAAVLAGGRSRRMGRDKALLPVSGHATLLERQLALLAAVRPRELFVSCRAEQRLPLPHGVRPVHDDGSAGPLGGIVALLGAMRTDALLVLAVDVAQMTSLVLRRIVGAADESGAIGIIPRTPSGPEPLAALFPRTILPLAEAQLEAGDDLSLQALVRRGIEAGALRWFDVAAHDLSVFENWNEPRNYRRSAGRLSWPDIPRRIRKTP